MGVYYESSWSILSTIGLANFFFGWIVVAITKLTVLSAIPIIVSASGAVANGLCYYAWFVTKTPAKMAAAYAVADILWMVQQAGLSFYSYIILFTVLRNYERPIFLSLFWVFMMCILGSRATIFVSRIKNILEDPKFNVIVNRAHVAYFISLASMECLSAFFLLRTFVKVRRASEVASLKPNLLKHLMRSTEFRLAFLAVIGLGRATIFLFWPPSAGPQPIASQVDDFFFALECLFPVVLFIDMLASKLISAQNSLNDSHQLPNITPAFAGTMSSIPELPVQYSKESTSVQATRILHPRHISSYSSLTGAEGHSDTYSGRS